jgi:hypothetical protein
MKPLPPALLLLVALITTAPAWSQADVASRALPVTEPRTKDTAAPASEFRPVKHYVPAYGLGVLAVGTQLWAGAVYGGSGVQHYRGQFVGAMIVGPSIGQIYAGSTLPAVGGMVARGVGAVLLGQSDDCSVEDCSGLNDGKYMLGILLFGGGIVYGIVDTKFAVDRANDRARKAALSTANLSPMVYPTRDGRLAPGLAFNASF